jgi:hypothetical protein
MNESTESELSEAYEKERTALALAKSEAARLLALEPRLLKTETVDGMIKLYDAIRRENIAADIAAARMAPLKIELEMVQHERAKWSGVDMPDDDALDKLLTIVSAAYPELKLAREQGRFDISVRAHRREFKAAFYACGRLGRLSEPSSDRYFHNIVDDVNRVLSARRIADVEGDAVHAALVAHGDVLWRAPDAALGQLMEVGLARIGQGTPAVAKWRDILSGKANLLAPLPPRNAHASSSSYPTPRVRIRYGDGREVDPSKDSWAQ